MSEARSGASGVDARSLFSALIDDAAVFPPGEMPVELALQRHREHTKSGYSEVVGPLVLGPRHLAQAIEAEGTAPTSSQAIDVVLTGPLEDVERGLRMLDAVPSLVAVGIEIAPAASAPPTDGASPLTELAAAVAALGGERSLRTALEVNYFGSATTPSVADLSSVSQQGVIVKFRTGGTSADAFPSDTDLAAAVTTAVAARAPFKLTAGLHEAVRRTMEDGFDHHGYLNVLLAVDAAARSLAESDSIDAASSAAAAWIAERDAGRLTAAAAALDLPRARRFFRSFGSCSIREPLESALHLDLADFGGLPPLEHEPIDTHDDTTTEMSPR